MKKVLILNYHNISDDTSGDPLYTITPSTFEQHLNVIEALKIPVTGMGDLMRNSRPEQYSIALSFDDGYKSAITEVIPLLEKRGHPAVFFPVTGLLGEPDRLSWDDVRSISAKGFEIGSHGISHTILTRLPLSDLEKELNISKTLIEEKINAPVNFFAPPYGIYNAGIARLAKKAGYSLLLTTGLKSNTINAEPFLLYRWNITGETSVETMKRMLQANGNLPFTIRLTFFIKRIVKKMLGPGFTESLTRKYSHG